MTNYRLDSTIDSRELTRKIIVELGRPHFVPIAKGHEVEKAFCYPLTAKPIKAMTPTYIAASEGRYGTTLNQEQAYALFGTIHLTDNDYFNRFMEKSFQQSGNPESLYSLHEIAGKLFVASNVYNYVVNPIGRLLTTGTAMPVDLLCYVSVKNQYSDVSSFSNDDLYAVFLEGQEFRMRKVKIHEIYGAAGRIRSVSFNGTHYDLDFVAEGITKRYSRKNINDISGAINRNLDIDLNAIILK